MWRTITNLHDCSIFGLLLIMNILAFTEIFASYGFFRVLGTFQFRHWENFGSTLKKRPWDAQRKAGIVGRRTNREAADCSHVKADTFSQPNYGSVFLCKTLHNMKHALNSRDNYDPWSRGDFCRPSQLVRKAMKSLNEYNWMSSVKEVDHVEK